MPVAFGSAVFAADPDDRAGFADRADWAVFPGVAVELSVVMPASLGACPCCEDWNRWRMPIADPRMMHAAAITPTTSAAKSCLCARQSAALICGFPIMYPF